MKQKFFIIKDDNEKKLTIREFAELDRDDMSPICEELYDSKMIKSAIKKGKEALISVIRTNNLYPLRKYTEKIAESIIELYAGKDKTSVELFFNDVDMLQSEKNTTEMTVEKDEASEHMNELLDDEFENNTEEKEILDKIDPALKTRGGHRVDGDDND